jgi:predicted TIM-barrel fold metal-dependent hydrolase
MAEDRLVIDLHHHFLPGSVLAELQQMAGGKPRLVNDRISITLNPDIADLDAHLRAMDHAGVDVAVLTQSGVSVLGPATCRSLNDGLAEVAERYPDRIVACAHVDLEDEGAVEELDRCVESLGYRIVALPCSTPTLDLDDPSLDPLWARLDVLALPVILHPAQLPRGASLDYGLERSCARPFDTTIAAVRLMGGVLGRYPGLRFVLPHCGGTAVVLRGRLAMFFTAPGDEPRSLPRTLNEQRHDGADVVFDELWSMLYFDTAGTGAWAPAVEFTVSVVGADHMVFGTDFPLEAHSPETMRELVEMLSHLDLPEESKDAIAHRSAQSLLGAALAHAHL